ncbi:MAG: hypothetical protein ACI977_000463 [Candidatus Nanohaloarchaea archaeon]
MIIIFYGLLCKEQELQSRVVEGSADGGKEWDIADTWGMINDGNHRTVAKVLADNSE